MKPIGNGLVNIVGEKTNERGFSCMKLIKFMWNDDKYNTWDAWHGAHLAASQGNCPFRIQCDVCKRTMKNHPAKQLDLFQ